MSFWRVGCSVPIVSVGQNGRFTGTEYHRCPPDSPPDSPERASCRRHRGIRDFPERGGKIFALADVLANQGRHLLFQFSGQRVVSRVAESQRVANFSEKSGVQRGKHLVLGLHDELHLALVVHRETGIIAHELHRKVSNAGGVASDGGDPLKVSE